MTSWRKCQNAFKMGMSYVYKLQQNNNNKHTAELNRNIWDIPKQPAQYPDLNPIEHLWATLKRVVHKVSIISKHHLKRVVIREWEAISPEICRHLANYMHRRCVLITRAKGNATKYWNMKCRLVTFFFISKLKSSVVLSILILHYNMLY